MDGCSDRVVVPTTVSFPALSLSFSKHTPPVDVVYQGLPNQGPKPTSAKQHPEFWDFRIQKNHRNRRILQRPLQVLASSTFLLIVEL
jgi:hypothetical protein